MHDKTRVARSNRDPIEIYIRVSSFVLSPSFSPFSFFLFPFFFFFFFFFFYERIMQAPSANRSGRCVSLWDSARFSRICKGARARAHKKFIGLEKQVAREVKKKKKLKRTTLLRFFLSFFLPSSLPSLPPPHPPRPAPRTGAPINDLNPANYRGRRASCFRIIDAARCCCSGLRKSQN
jgi:hypothetical protein